MNTRINTPGFKKTVILATAAAAFLAGISAATAETLACRKCREAYNACLASGTDPQTCYDNDEACRVRNRCWVN